MNRKVLALLASIPLLLLISLAVYLTLDEGTPDPGEGTLDDDYLGTNHGVASYLTVCWYDGYDAGKLREKLKAISEAGGTVMDIEYTDKGRALIYWTKEALQ